VKFVFTLENISIAKIKIKRDTPASPVCHCLVHLFYDLHHDSDSNGTSPGAYMCCNHMSYMLAVMDNLGCDVKEGRVRGRGHGGWTWSVVQNTGMQALNTHDPKARQYQTMRDAPT
jgi:hypothetical protein